MKIKDLCFAYDDKVIFEKLNLDFNEDRTAIMGESGRGKTTLLKLIAGLLKPNSGIIEHDYKKIAILFQEDRLLPWLNVKDNLSLVCLDENKIRDILNILDIDESLSISELSGGMARRVALARALLIESDLLLLDEPFTGMDKKLIKKIAKLILSKNKQIIVSIHDEKQSELLKAKIVVL